MSAPTTTGPGLRRVDARGKVTGTVHYGTDLVLPGMLHGVLAVSTAAKGRILSFETRDAETAPGVRLVLTGPGPGEQLVSGGFLMGGGHGFQSLQPLTDDSIAYRGQPIALVVADTLHEAQEGARLVTARYATEPIAVELHAEGVEVVDQETAIPMPMFADLRFGDADEAFAAAEVQIDAEYDSPPQHPAPMELIGAVVEWEGERLTIHESTQNANAVRFGVAEQLGLDPQDVQVISPYVGGAFGNKNSLQPHTALAALAARRLGRSVKLVLTREQMFLTCSFRPANHHRVRLGASRDGRLVTAIHEIDQQTSRHDTFPASYIELTSRMYALEHFRGHQRLVKTDTQTPGYMRAPHEHAAAFAFESAVDEMAHALGQDPVALRLANDTTSDPVTGHPFSSRHVNECLRRGAERFGWAARTPEPGSMATVDGTQVGWGVAIGAYPGSTVPSITRMSVDANGCLTVRTGGHEMGQGIRTAITELVVGDLGLLPDAVIVDIGDTRSVPQHLTAGAWGTATALPGVKDALVALRRRLTLPETGTVDLIAAVAASGEVEVEVERRGPGQPPEIMDQLRQGGMAPAGPEYPEFTTFSYAAHFVEVRIEATTRRIRVSRVVSVADCGRVASQVTAASQLRGGVVWGIGACLREASEVDPRYGGFLNADLAEYAVVVQADMPEIDVSFIDEPDYRFNPLGVKSLGEVSMVGVAPAVANAVWHASGRRLRRMPMRVEDVL